MYCSSQYCHTKSRLNKEKLTIGGSLKNNIAVPFGIKTVSLTISVLQACCAVTTEYGIPSNFISKSTASLQIKISTAQLNFSNRNVIIF